MQTKTIESMMTASQRNMPVKNLPSTLVENFFIENKDKIANALPKSIRPEKLISDALQCTMKNPRLMQCSTESLFGAIMECAQLGLELTKGMNQVHLVPFYETKTGQNKVNVIVGYSGLISLAVEHPSVFSISPKVVYENDTYSYKEGSNAHIEHEPAPYSKRGNPIAYYAIAQLQGGATAVFWMWKEEVDKVKETVHKKNKGKNMHIWNQHFDAMAMKTTVRRICKYLPRSPQLGRALEMIDKEELGEENCFTIDSVAKESEINDEIESTAKEIAHEKISQEQLDVLSSRCMELTLDGKINSDKFYAHIENEMGVSHLKDIPVDKFDYVKDLFDKAESRKEK